MSQRKSYEEYYARIMRMITSLGHSLLTSFDVLTVNPTTSQNQNPIEREAFHKRWFAVIAKTDIAVLEVSHPSTVNIGIELAQLIDRGKPVVCLYKQTKDPSFVGEQFSRRLIKLQYDEDDLEDMVVYGLEEAALWLNRRFTFYISGEIEAYLDRVTKKTGHSKSEFIRGLIEKEIERTLLAKLD